MVYEGPQTELINSRISSVIYISVVAYAFEVTLTSSALPLSGQGKSAPNMLVLPQLPLMAHLPFLGRSSYIEFMIGRVSDGYTKDKARGLIVSAMTRAGYDDETHHVVHVSLFPTTLVDSRDGPVQRE
jgi:hypothetical protein